MQKGQLSIDLMFAIIIVAMFLQLLIGTGETIQEGNSVSVVILQEKRILSEIESFYIASRTLEVPGAEFSSRFRTGTLTDIYAIGEQDCDIEYNNATNELKIIYTMTTPDGPIDVEHIQEIVPSTSAFVIPNPVMDCDQLQVIGNA